MIFRNRSSVGTAISVSAAALAFGTSAVALEPSKKSSTIKACYKKKSGSLRMLAQGKRCKPRERSITWGKRGAAGSSGDAGQKGPAGPVGPVGLDGVFGVAGPAGSPGSQGSAGTTGATGPVGPSTSREAVNNGPVTITGIDAGSANSIATLSGLPAGDYLVTARVQLNTSGTSAASVSCRASLGGKTALAVADIGSNANSVDHLPIVITFNGTLGSAGNANVQCWHDTLTGGAPTATNTYVEALTVGTASSTSVTS
jgi:Collagen triple helix repeat (20 copies)